MADFLNGKKVETVTVTVEGPSYVNKFELPINMDAKSQEWRLWTLRLRMAIQHAVQLQAFEKGKR